MRLMRFGCCTGQKGSISSSVGRLDERIVSGGLRVIFNSVRWYEHAFPGAIARADDDILYFDPEEVEDWHEFSSWEQSLPAFYVLRDGLFGKHIVSRKTSLSGILLIDMIHQSARTYHIHQKTERWKRFE